MHDRLAGLCRVNEGDKEDRINNMAGRAHAIERCVQWEYKTITQKPVHKVMMVDQSRTLLLDQARDWHEMARKDQVVAEFKGWKTKSGRKGLRGLQWSKKPETK